MKCETCASQRWQMYAARWKDDKLSAEWRPFDRGSWSFLAPTELAAALATKTLRPCPACNRAELAPWSRSWAADVSAPVPTETPF